MDGYQNNYKSTNGFALASMILGIGSILLCCTGFLSLPMGALGILFAILSHRKAQSMPGMSIAGICTSIVGLILGIIVCVYLAAVMVIASDPSLHHYLDPFYQNAYGMDFDEFMDYMGYPLN